MELICSTCKEYKDCSLFSKKTASKRGYNSRCKSCHNEYSRTKWYPKHQQQQILASNKWKEENKLRVKATQYGLDIKEVEEFLVKADGKCQICEKPSNLCLDHCHTSGKIRGFLCSKCNCALGFFYDDPEVMNKAVKYLDKFLNAG